MKINSHFVNILLRPGHTYRMLMADKPSLATGLLMLSAFTLGYLGVVLIGVSAVSLPSEKVVREIIVALLWQYALCAVLVFATRVVAAFFSPEEPSLTHVAALTSLAFVVSQLVLLAVDYVIITWLAVSRAGLTSFVNSLPGAILVGLYQPATVVWLLYQHAASVQALYRTTRPAALAIALASMAPLVGGFLLAPYLNIVI